MCRLNRLTKKWTMTNVWENENNEVWNEEEDEWEDIFNNFNNLYINALAPLPALGQIDWEIEGGYRDISEEFWGLIDNYFTGEINFDSGEDWDAECEHGWTWELYNGWIYTG